MSGLVAERAGSTEAHVVVAIPVLLTGGTEVQTLALVRGLAGRYRVTVCCYHEYDPAMVERFRAAGAAVDLLQWDRRMGLGRLVLELRKVFAARAPDAVHVQYLAPGLAAVLAARLARVPVVLTTMHLPGFGIRARGFARVARALSDAFICVSENLERFWCGATHVPDPAHPDRRRPHETIRNCVDMEAVVGTAGRADRAALRSALSLGAGPVIGVVGRLRREKGQRTLLEAMPAVLRASPGAQVLIVGDGPDRSELAALAARLGVADAIRWAGQVPMERVAEHYALMDVLAVPSLYEAFGLVAAEAMALGLPVVGTETAGLSEVVEAGRSGILVPPGDAGALAEALIGVIADPAVARSMGGHGRERVRARFSRERYERDLLAVYDRVLAARCQATERNGR